LVLSLNSYNHNNNNNNNNNRKKYQENPMSPVYKLNRMASTVRKLESYLPKSFHPWGYTLLFNHMVKLAGTARLQVETLSAQKVQVHLKNRTSIQNHIGGLHACSMVLAAESATGIIVGMNVPDSHIPLIKHMTVDFVRRCQGGVTATATLSDEDYHRIQTDDRGDVKVQVIVQDESGQEPIQTEMIWAWVSKERKSSSSTPKK
jgi:acyl-coenzyme A thioesterase PaaI-like protein